MKLLVTGAWQCTKEQLERLESQGNDIIFLQNEKEELSVPYDIIEGVICNGLFLYHDIKKFTSLKYIQLTSAGFDRVPMDSVREKNIKIFNARGVYSVPMAEFAICGVLQLYKENRFFLNNQRAHRWEKHRGLLELCGKSICIVGCGNIGTECATRFKAFGTTIFGVDLYPREDESYEKIYPLNYLDEAISFADVVVLTLPLTEETTHLFNKERFDKMKKGALIVNISRGAVVDTNALSDALDCHLGGAVLDVFEEEPLLESSPLWEKENVILTPHNSFVGDGNNQRLWNIILENLSKGI